MMLRQRRVLNGRGFGYIATIFKVLAIVVRNQINQGITSQHDAERQTRETKADPDQGAHIHDRHNLYERFRFLLGFLHEEVKTRPYRRITFRPVSPRTYSPTYLPSTFELWWH